MDYSIFPAAIATYASTCGTYHALWYLHHDDKWAFPMLFDCTDNSIWKAAIPYEGDCVVFISMRDRSQGVIQLVLPVGELETGAYTTHHLLADFAAYRNFRS
jgi:hypothetical protein